MELLRYKTSAIRHPTGGKTGDARIPWQSSAAYGDTGAIQGRAQCAF
jgi:hypothetical protein